MEILLITSILFITLMLFLLIPVRVSLKAEKEVSFWYLLSISCLKIFSIAFSPKGRRMKIGFMSFTKHNNNPLASPFSKGGHRGIFEGGVKRLIDGLKIFKNIKPYFKVEKMKVDGEVGFDNIFLTGLVPLSISILKDFFAENANVNIRPDYFNEGFKGRMEFSGSIRMGFLFLVLAKQQVFEKSPSPLPSPLWGEGKGEGFKGGTMSELIKSLINSVMDELKSVAKAEVVVGKEIEFDGKKVIPVSRVSIKFLVGGGEDRSGRKGYGSGGIGDAKVEPVAFLISDGKEIKALQLKGNGVSSLIDIVPKVVDALLEKGEGQKEEKKKEKNFFKFAKEKK